MFNHDLWKEARKQILPLAASIILGALIGGLIVYQAWLLSKMIAGVFLNGWSLTDIRADLTILAAVIVVRAGMVFAREVSAGLVSIKVQASLRQQLFSNLLDLSPIQVSQERTGEIANTIIQGVGRLDAYFRTYLPQLSLAVLVPVIILVVVFPLDWLTGVIFFVTAPLIPLFMILIGKEAEHRTNRQWRLLGRLSSHFLDVLQGLRTLKAFGLSKRQAGVIRSVSEEYARVTLGVLRIAFLSALALELLATISTAIVAVQIGLRLLNGQITFVESLFVLVLAPEFYLPLRQLGAAFHSGMEGIAAADRIYQLAGAGSEMAAGGSQPVPPLSDQGELRFENVRYAYQGGDRPSLKGIDMTVPVGKHTALVGTSGAGKSTVFALLLGFMEPDAGRIVVGGTDFSDLYLAAWRAKIGWVPQFPYLFRGTVFENILVGKSDASEQAVVQASKQANIHGFITSLPDGYQTMIGERGFRLSGGQAQRIAIARAFLRGAEILLLDEPSSSLDIESIKAIHQAIDSYKDSLTVVTISHQLSRVRSAGKIIVIEDGRVHQSGSHEDLIAAEGLYRALAEAGGTTT